jgi:hypothetical protein
MKHACNRQSAIGNWNNSTSVHPASEAMETDETSETLFFSPKQAGAYSACAHSENGAMIT